MFSTQLLNFDFIPFLSSDIFLLLRCTTELFEYICQNV